MKPKVAWMLIVAAGNSKSAPDLTKALASVNGYVDEIFIQLNALKGKKISPIVRQAAEQFTDKIFVEEWHGNFVEARNKLLDKVPKSFAWVGWMDVDDTIENPEMIQPTAAIMSKDIHGVFIMYDYEHDDHGNVIISHWTTRMVRNDGSFRWKSSIDDDEVSVHETLVATRGVKSVANNEWKVIHHTTPDHRIASLDRNIELLRGMYIRQSRKGDIDPRILFYLATHLYDAYDFKEVKNLLYQYLRLSGWNEERAEAHVYMGKIFKMEENNEMAKTAFLLAIGENPKNTNAYLELAKLEFDNSRFTQAVEWLRIALEVKQNITPMVRFNNQHETYSLMAECLTNIGGKELDEAYKWIVKAIEIRPYNEQTQTARDKVQFLINHRDNMKAANRLIRELENGNETYKVLPLLDSLPSGLADTAPVIGARQKYTDPIVWSKKSIVIYTGNSSMGIWGPWSLNEGGIGGSEEAVVRLSDELANLGWKVTVYGTPGERTGDYIGTVKQFGTDAKLYIDGVLTKQAVTWKQYWELNVKDTFDVLISWRQPEFFDFTFKARKKYLWLHDVIPKEEFTKERINNFDRAIFVSQYHADRPEFTNIPKSKKFVSSNGITPEEFNDDESLKRDSYRCIYMSANERGLRILYDIWADVKKAVPKATLDVYYGWQSFDAVNRDNPERMMWKAMMRKQARELDGVTERGRIGQDELNQEIFKSGIWAYPTFFPEVNCITGQKAMAGGAVPVTSDYAVMKDIVQYGEQVPMNNFDEPDIERYKKRLIGWLKSPEKQERVRKEMMAWARENFAWSKTAAQWNKEMS